jgi:hypothetical protein
MVSRDAGVREPDRHVARLQLPGERRSEVGLPGQHTRMSLAAQLLRPPLIDARCTDQLERPGRPPALRQIGPFEHSGARLDQRGVRVGRLGDGRIQGNPVSAYA